MNTELDALSEKIDRVLALVDDLRTENHSLKGKLLASESERQALRSRIDAVRERLEILVQHIPGDGKS